MFLITLISSACRFLTRQVEIGSVDKKHLRTSSAIPYITYSLTDVQKLYITNVQDSSANGVNDLFVEQKKIRFVYLLTEKIIKIMGHAFIRCNNVRHNIRI